MGISVKNFYEMLEWDTDFFGFAVAKIIPHRLTAGELESILALLKKQNVCLAYWACDPSDRESQQSANSFGGFLADKKIIYGMNLRNAPEACFRKVETSIEEYLESLPNAALEALALESGVFSRFNVDPKIPKEQFESLYKLWILNSVNKKIADAVFVARDRGKIFGMATVSTKNDCGHIGIIAVDKSMRRRHVGVDLVHTAQNWFVLQNSKTAQVVAQKDNVAACNLYEKCGFHIEKTEHFYHFWL
jgi:dTDP-4-amino-4,6-dideoxy-D-galactose acyltransferase